MADRNRTGGLVSEMIWILWLFLSFTTPAHAQCTGIFGASTFCGSVAGGPPGPIPFSSIGGLVGTSPITGGTTQQLLYDNAGILGEVTKGNSCIYLTNGSGVPSCSNTLNGSPSLATTTLVYGMTGLPVGSGTWTGTSANDSGGGGTNTYLGPAAGPASGGVYLSSGSRGTENVVIGYVAGQSLTTGTANNIIGGGAGLQITTGGQNALYGRHAQRNNHTGTDVVAIGEFANNGNTPAAALGTTALTLTASIASSLLTVTATSGTIVNGMHIGGAGIGDDSCAISSFGTGAGGTGTYHLDCSPGTIGSEAMTASLVDLTQSVCVGSASCYYAADPGPLASSFGQIVGVGYGALQRNYTGTLNTAVGYQSMQGNGTSGITGNANTAVGAASCQSLSSGTQNVCIGEGAGNNLVTASANTIVGMQAGLSTTGSNNTLIGYNAGEALSTGTGNLFVVANGPFGGNGITTGTNNTVIGNPGAGLSASLASAIIFCDGSGTGCQADYGKTNAGGWTLSGKTFLPNIGTDATKTDATVCEDTTTHQLYFGSGASGVCLGTSSIRFKHDVASLVPGLAEVMNLQPIEYKYNAGYGDPNHKLYGFTAEQGESTLPDLVGRDKDGKPNTFDLLGVVPVLVKAIQQQQAEIEELKAKIK